jgi:hypothetical protein
MPIIRFRPEVADDLRNAVEWYNAKKTGLGDEFLGEYWSAIERIMNQPLAYGVGQTGLRAWRELNVAFGKRSFGHRLTEVTWLSNVVADATPPSKTLVPNGPGKTHVRSANSRHGYGRTTFL